MVFICTVGHIPLYNIGRPNNLTPQKEACNELLLLAVYIYLFYVCFNRQPVVSLFPLSVDTGARNRRKTEGGEEAVGDVAGVAGAVGVEGEAAGVVVGVGAGAEGQMTVTTTLTRHPACPDRQDQPHYLTSLTLR